jgi:hypothetical protein
MPAPKRPSAPTRQQLEHFRSNFKQLLLENPNFFGNLPSGGPKAVLKLLSNTTYEELTCVGYNPRFDSLEATVQIKRATGYGGDLCQAGSLEYVHFFVDYGSGWQSVGVASFNAHDIPAARDCAGQANAPRSYVVSLPLDPERDFCRRPQLPAVRAILSWSYAPPVDPNWHPTWGNVLDRHVQISPRPWLLKDVIGEVAGTISELSKPIAHLADTEIEPPEKVPALTLAERKDLYAKLARGKEAVPPTRFAAPELLPLLSLQGISADAAAIQATQFKDVGLDISDLLASLEKTKGDVGYEELGCVGLDYNREWLYATFAVKRPFGYSGDLCHRGSTEYVSFWADWEDKCAWSYLGTAEVQVHDIPTIPSDGLQYAALLPVDLDSFRRSCETPLIGRVRAVLSWSAPPSTTDPDDVPHWGNRLDTHVEIKPAFVPAPDEPHISILGGIGIAEIGVTTDGLTTPSALFALTGTPADGHSRRCPFGGLVVVQGPPLLGRKYRVQARSGGATVVVTHPSAPIRTIDLNGVGTWRTPSPAGFLDYLPATQNIDNVLAWWSTSGDDLWEIWLELADSTETVIGVTSFHLLQLDNTGPEADIHISSGGDCKDFGSGVVVTGEFVARDAWFGSFSLSTHPNSATIPSVQPTTATPATAQTAPRTPATGPVWSGGDGWEVNTSAPIPGTPPRHMGPCGYVVRVDVADRAIVNSSPGGHPSYAETAFCLRA